MEEIKNYNGNNRWRFSKEIPIAVALFLVGQTVSGVWFFAIQNKTLTDVVSTINGFATTFYTKDAAESEKRLQLQIQLNAAERLNELLRRVSILEGQSSSKR